MRFIEYVADKWVSVVIFVIVFICGGGLLMLIETPFAVACVVEGFYAAGFFLILIQDYAARRGFYDRLLEATEGVEEISYLSEFLEEPNFLEGRLLCRILKKDEKYMNDRLAANEQELQEYKDYVETWAHEIKTPIAVSRLIMENNRDDTTRSLAEEMDKLEGFVEQMLYYSKGSSLNGDYRMRVIPLKDLVMKAIKGQAKYMIAEKVTPRFENLDYEVLTDSRWIHFILNQIIANGIKYHTDERKAELVFSASRTGKTITLSIADNGIGIPPEDIERVRRKGFTGENGRKYGKSTGMGLYICDTLCRKLGTELIVSSKVGEGTVVSLRLAVAPEEINSNIS
ncbi:sensor histidine kinase [Bariatricus massiliensis]|uniref:histidine kinase n=1 Tax=Bariatricus massiliensis TaxID=1745713 RepID=A0ABS8DGD8_9FIRM|nr:sensor histidine kinase [Bariatricus massiliensis]MCB7302988.1 sensor histidine kinase [Bariatricus massiliensis]MCB7374204.1 sensor histidine kinase [Bariatricus massiliensis]MCB7386874.1 sensor histidine kinase [Bariatricus massiliensis]MCB7411036.1 sensor histidine kinase [Bariatricus massiliensis]MCQ5251862.1 sensor histidine kinase [Bariatricus massiliensis]